MTAIVFFHIFRQVFKGTKAGAKVIGLLDKDVHPHTYHCYCSLAIAVYVSHIAVSLYHGIEVESCVTAAATAIELVGHLMEICAG